MGNWVLNEKKLRERLATNVKRCRAKRGLSLEEAANDGSMHWRHWQKIEKGEVSPTLRTVAKLALALDVEPFQLLK